MREQSVTTAKLCTHACCCHFSGTFPVYQRRSGIREKFRVHFLIKRMGRDSSLPSHNLYSRPATALIHGRTLNGTKTTCEKSNCITTLSSGKSLHNLHTTVQIY